MGLQRVRQDWATEQQQVIANLVILEGRFYYLHFIDVKNILKNNEAVFVDNMYVYIRIYIHMHIEFFYQMTYLSNISENIWGQQI